MVRFIFIFLICSMAFGQKDYFLGSRLGLFQIQAGWVIPEKSNEIYDFSEDLLTFDRDKLDGTAFNMGYSFQLNNYVAIGGAFSVYSEDVQSEDREFIFDDGSAIRQETGLETFWGGATLTFTPTGSGSYVGTKAWLPRLFVPYIQVGIGIKSFDFYQEGEFVDVDTLDVFYDYFSDTGTAGSVKVALGLRINLNKHIDFDINAQKDWAETELAGDFEGFGDLDFGSESYYAGVTIRLGGGR